MGADAKRPVRPPEFPVQGTMFGTLGPGPAVLLIGGSGGGELVETGEWLWREGIPSLSLTYFGREGLPSSLRDVPLEYFRDAITALAARPSGTSGPTVLIGVSRGSEAALLTAAHFPDIVDGVIALVPSNLTVCSWPPGGAAWLLNGAPLPYSLRFGPYTHDPSTEIPVEKIRGALLLISAGADQTWPSSAMSRRIATRMAQNGRGSGVQHVDYPDSTHALGRLSVSEDELAGRREWPADEVARSDARRRILDFLRTFPGTRTSAH